MKTVSNRSGWLGGATSVLASAVALVCPACIPAIASLLASLGIGLAAKEQFIRPFLIGLIVLAVASFVWSAKLHRHWWVVATGLVGGVLVYMGRYYLGFGELWMNQFATWVGTGVLIGTALVNLKLKRGCPSCAKDTLKPDAGNGSCCDVERTQRKES
jgi:hypothetical protein